MNRLYSVILIMLVAGLTFQPADTNKKSSSADQPAVTVGMTNTLTFDPDTVRIKKGQTVLWKNNSLLVHSVTADPSEATLDASVKLPKGAKTFDSGLMDPEKEFEHTFKKTGTYKYFCIPHEGAKMYGWVIVE